MSDYEDRNIPENNPENNPENTGLPGDNEIPENTGVPENYGTPEGDRIPEDAAPEDMDTDEDEYEDVDEEEDVDTDEDEDEDEDLDEDEYEDSDEAEAEAEGEDESEGRRTDSFSGQGRQATGPRKKQVKWKSVLVGLVVFAVVGSLVQIVLRGGGFGGSLGTGSEESKPPEKGQSVDIAKPSTKPKTIKLGSNNIPVAAGPIIVVNPGLVAPGGRAVVEGSGFDAGATVVLALKAKATSSKGRTVTTVKADKNGSISAPIRMPDTGSAAAAFLVAQQSNSEKIAEAQLVAGGGIGSVKINKAAGKPGDSVRLNIRGFGPGEPIDVYWGRVAGKPVAKLTADGSGGIGRADIKVGVAPTGSSTLVLVGRKTKTTATAPFEMLGLFPSVKSSPYALKSGEQIALSAKGFAPGERVLFYINSASGVPAFTANADGNGNVGDVAFEVPFGLQGKQNLTAIGDQTRAVVRSGFQVLPYTPTAEPSTYSGKPGTGISFYVSGFAPKERVVIYAGGTHDSPGKQVGTFVVNDRGEAEGVGQYQITKADQNGVSFKLVGQLSKSETTAAVNSAQDEGEGEGEGQGQGDKGQGQ